MAAFNVFGIDQFPMTSLPPLPSALAALLICAAWTTPTRAGEPAHEIQEPPPEAASEAWDWCEWLSNKPGTLYKNSENPFIQEFVLGARFQWQAAHISGDDVFGDDFSDTFTDVRRFRLESSTTFLQVFKLKAIINLVDDSRFTSGGELDWGYQDFDEAVLSLDLRKAFDLEAVDALSISYGRYKFLMGQEAHTSSKELYTVERSAIVNKVYGGYRPTGFSANVGKGSWSLTGALYSTDEGSEGGNNEFIGGWNDGLAYYASVGYQANDSLKLVWDFVYNDADATDGDDSLWTYGWATSLSAHHSREKWGVILNAIYGDNGDASNNAGSNRRGDFWGVVAMPHMWIFEDKLEAVGRYQYAGSAQGQGHRTNSRYYRAEDHDGMVNSGRGNEHHSLYAGLNYYICGHNLKVQAGLEYDWLNSPGAGTRGDSDAWTWWFGFRTFF